jgi:hypothetical protein
VILEKLESDERKFQEKQVEYKFEIDNTKRRMIKKEKNWHERIVDVRSRVENIFGFLFTKFESLNTFFQKSLR